MSDGREIDKWMFVRQVLIPLLVGTVIGGFYVLNHNLERIAAALERLAK